MKVVTDDGGTGTAFYMGDSEFITAAHVVEGYSSVRLEIDNLSVVAQVVGVSTSTDVAILRASTSMKPLQWGNSSTLAVGQSVALAGYPKGLGTSATVTGGLISRIDTTDNRRVIQTDAAASPGSSGGPAFNECGRVVGMLIEGDLRLDVEGIAYFVAEDRIRSALLYVRAHPLVECSTWKLNVEAGGSYEWGWDVLPAGYRVSGEFSVEPGGVGDLDIRFYLVGQSAPDGYQNSSGTFEFSGSSAGVYKIVFDNSYSLFTSKNITINWCEYE